ncbi:MAG: hypothetical protein A2Z96_04620 [Spirochaetes bacterium GWB1_48_6]|nr:MAG: hypothetical protein A2Z96_04620 [Spirochaetes bacterium GWB1_48_6]
MFKLHNPLVVLDLEATAEKEGRVQKNDYIIDIGAVLLDENLQEVDRFDALVKPGVPVNEFITKLTGISNPMLENQPGWEVVGPAFTAWVKGHCGNPKKARLAAWGNYFDIPLLRRNYEDKNLDFPFAGTALDVKTLSFLWLSLSGRRTDKLNLQILADLMEIKPEGVYHRAITDALVTARILQRVWRDLQGFYLPGKEGDPFGHFLITPAQSFIES